jgi:hypothetical protein
MDGEGEEHEEIFSNYVGEQMKELRSLIDKFEGKYKEIKTNGDNPETKRLDEDIDDLKEMIKMITEDL